jgi:glycosyltransferase involved in cell wall biosynthesis
MKTHAMFYGTPLAFFPRETLTGDFDVIHCNFPNPYFSACSALMSKLRGVDAVLTWHNDLPGVTSTASIVAGFHDLVSPTYLRRFARIITTTNIYAQNSITLRHFSERLVMIPNGVDSFRFNPGIDGSCLRSELGVSAEDVLVAFVGALTRWHTYKGLEVLLAAMKDVLRLKKNVKLLVVGGGELMLFYQKVASNFGILDHVFFVGSVTDDKLPEYYAACDLLVLPSKNRAEGYGLVLLEAMATGKPVVASEIGGIVEVVSNGNNGVLVPPNDVSALSDAICSLAGNPEARERLGLIGRGFAEMNDWNLVAQKIAGLYREVVGTNGKGKRNV